MMYHDTPIRATLTIVKTEQTEGEEPGFASSTGTGEGSLLLFWQLHGVGGWVGGCVVACGVCVLVHVCFF